MPITGKRIITEQQRDVLSSFSKIPDSAHFYLTGGTALSEFYFGHRRSFDLDLFTSQRDLLLPFSRMCEEKLSQLFNVRVVRRFESFVEFEVGRQSSSVKLQLAYDSPFRFGEPVDSDIGVKVNNLEDLSIDKLLAFFGRAEPRDAVDLFFILQQHEFWELSHKASQKDPGYDLYWMAVALEKVTLFPDEIGRWPVEMLLDVNVLELKKSFLTLSKSVMEKITGGE